MQSRYFAVPPREPLLWGVGVVVAGTYAAGIALAAEAMNPFELGISALFLVIVVGNLAFDMPRVSLSVSFVSLGLIVDHLNVLPELGEAGLSVWGWTFLLAGLAVFVQSWRHGASRHRFEEFTDDDVGAE